MQQLAISSWQLASRPQQGRVAEKREHHKQRECAHKVARIYFVFLRVLCGERFFLCSLRPCLCDFWKALTGGGGTAQVVLHQTFA